MSRYTLHGDKGLRICSPACDECPFKGGCDLRPGRLKQIVKECHAVGREKPFVCHKTLPSVSGRRGEAAVCGGFHQAYPQCSTIQQIAGRLGLVELVPPPKTR